MMRIQPVSRTGGKQSFCSATLDSLSLAKNTDDLCMLGGVSKDGTFGWLARGSCLEVFLLRTGQRISAWCFGALLKEPSTVITAICECYYDRSSTLIVATSTINPEGLVCLFDPKNSKIIKTIEIPYAVKSLEIVSSGSQRQAQTILFCEQLNHFCGILAVGTHCGHVYLVDLSLDDEVDGCDELSPDSLQHLDNGAKDVLNRRFNAIKRGKHLCLELGEEYHVRGYYNYCTADHQQLKSFGADDVCISSLKFVERTASLVVGFSFGCFQLWRLQGPSLDYSCRFEDGLPPVNSIAYQEPENDPRNYCYLWIARGPQPSDSVEDYTSNITLYQLGYDKKNWHSGFGYLFQNLKAVGPRFEHDLTSDPYNMNLAMRAEGSRIISCFTVENITYQPPAGKIDNDDSFEGSLGPDLSLCAFVWEAAPVDPQAKPPCYLGLFDMNRWYHAQMPGTLRLYGGSSDVCPYFAMCSLDGVQQEAGTDNIMALYLSRTKLSRFQSVMIPEPEQHFYPSAYTFSVDCVMETGVLHAKYLGVPRQILSEIVSTGPAVLVEPHDLYNLCIQAGLLPRSTELSSASLPVPYKREALLSMALDHNMSGFLHRCAVSLASGEMTTDGWSLRFLLEWAWKRIANIKENVDRLCVSLYDWSGVPLDRQTFQLVNQYHTALRTISGLISFMASQAVSTTDQGRLELDTKQQVVSLISEHLDLVLWFSSRGILPEKSEDDYRDEGFVYPSRVLLDFYLKRRAEIQKLHSGIMPSDVLLIDGLVEHMGDRLSSLWDKEGGDGCYPPPSIHAVVNMFLLESVDMQDKLCLVLYLLHDLQKTMPHDNLEPFEEKIERFIRKYDIPVGIAKLVQGMWTLDHKEYEHSMFYLLDPSVKSQISPNQHRCILKALLYQDKPKLALQYLKILSPPLTTPEDVKLKLTVLLANGLTSDAFEFQRISRNRNNVHDLLSHLFLGCQQTKTVDQLLLLPFSDQEESYLVNHLKTSSDVRSQELLVLYYLQRARYVEAVRLNHRIKQQYVGELDPVIRGRTRVRNCLVEGYHKLLPRIQRKLCLDPDRPGPHLANVRREYVRPKPLSTVVNRLGSRALTRSSLLETVLNKVHELKTEESDVVQEDDNSQKDQPPGPFVCTPITPRVRKAMNEVPDVVFPEVAEAPVNSPLSISNRSLGARMSPLAVHSPHKSRVNFSLASPHTLEKSSWLNSTLKRRQHLFTADALSLLQSPPVKKKTPLKKSPLVTSCLATPHSILKVRSQPSLDLTTVPVGKLSFKMDDLSMPTPPPILRRLTMGRKSVTAFQIDEESEVEPSDPIAMETTAVPVTEIPVEHSKTLRFANLSPEIEEKPMEVEENHSVKFAVSPIVRRSIRDRSPTPERKSPKFADKQDTLISPKVSSIRFSEDTGIFKSEETNVEEELNMIEVDSEITIQLGESSKIQDGFDDSDTEPLVWHTPSTGDTISNVVSSTSENEKLLENSAVIVNSDMMTTNVTPSSNQVAFSEEEAVVLSSDEDMIIEDESSDHGGDSKHTEKSHSEEITNGSNDDKSQNLHAVQDMDLEENMLAKTISENIVRKDEYVRGEVKESVTLNFTPEKVTKTVIRESVTRTKSVKVFDVENEVQVSTSNDVLGLQIENGAGDQMGIAADSTSHVISDVVSADSTSNDILDESELNHSALRSTRSRKSVTRSASTRGKKNVETTPPKADNDAMDVIVTTPSRKTRASPSRENLAPRTPTRRSSRQHKIHDESIRPENEPSEDTECSHVDMAYIRRSLRQHTLVHSCILCTQAKKPPVTPPCSSRTASPASDGSPGSVVSSAPSSPRRSTRIASQANTPTRDKDTTLPSTPTRSSTRVKAATPTRSTKKIASRSRSPSSTTEVAGSRRGKGKPSSRSSSMASSRENSPTPTAMETEPADMLTSRVTRLTRTPSRDTSPDKQTNIEILTPGRRTRKTTASSKDNTTPSREASPEKEANTKARIRGRRSTKSESLSRETSPSSVTSESISSNLKARRDQSRKSQTPSRDPSPSDTASTSTAGRSRLAKKLTETPSRDASPGSVMSESVIADENDAESVDVLTDQSDHESCFSDESDDTIVDHNDNVDFTFSNPLALAVKSVDDEPATPVPNFIFSPPLTRSRCRQSLHSGVRGLLKPNESNVIAEMSLSRSPARKPKSSKQRSKSMAIMDHNDSVSESVINFIPMPSEDELKPSRRIPKDCVTSATEKYTTLRPKKKKWTAF